ncbi:B-cell receptor CD22 isoform X1 [Bufo gargarizans]|uniref:B-cell receptor CD22 isoform X1 n=2 Tax=Bufo gargarizans TaxID=30331 RepID=UPI001CF5FAFF|nr:B-cell receptor CD22 isoform X1 [Bufo gargarizans]
MDSMEGATPCGLRIINNMGAWRTWPIVFLIFLFKDALNKDINRSVQLGSAVTAWEGSCAVLSCKILTYRTIANFTWYYNPEYDDAVKTFKGTIVYQSTKNAELNSPFADRVQYVGTDEKNCTILITNLTRQDSGSYQLRLMGKDWKWMSKSMLNLTVSDAGPGLKLHQVPEMQENQKVALTCSIDYDCPFYNMTLTWLQNVNGKEEMIIKKDIGEKRSTTTKLTFVPSWKDNNKMITCLLQRMNGANDNRTIQLDVKYAPQSVQIKAESPIKIVEGNTRTLECSVESSNPPNPTITWYKNNQRLNSKANREQFDESGRYYCEAKNEVSAKKSNTVEISVLHAPKHIFIQKPKENIKEGSKVSLNCSTVANPPVSRYIWYKNERLCFNGTDSRYNFPRIRENDSGSYVCEAFNDQGTSRSSPTKLDVKYPPKNVTVVIKPDSKQFREGTLVTFECVVNNSNPDVTDFAWRKNKIPLFPFSGKKAIRVEDAGMYTCEATNEIGKSPSDEVFVEVLYPPKSSSCTIPNGTNKREHKEAILKCPSMQSNPKISSYEWFKSRKLYKTTNSDSLYFPNVQWTDSGYYSCKAINTLGSSPEAECAYLRVEYAPKNVSISVSPGNFVTENINVQLTCTASANPNNNLEYTWYHKDQALQKSEKGYVLPNVQMSHAGEYYCVVQNGIGSNKSQVVHLHVSYSTNTIAMYSAAGIGPLIAIIIIVALIVHFGVWQKTCRKTDNDRSDSAFFVLKKKHNEVSDQLEQDAPSEDSLTDRINYASLQFPMSSNGGQNQPRRNPNHPEPNDIYSVVQKPRSAAEYENIDSSKITQDEYQDEIHYSIITNLNKSTARERDPDVEYAMLKH